MFKKEYIQPSIIIEDVEPFEIIASSPGNGAYQFDESGDNGNGDITVDNGNDESDAKGGGYTAWGVNWDYDEF